MTPSAATLTITTKKPALGSWVTPSAVINGHPVNLVWGANTLAAPPGQHRIELYMQWLWKYGKAEITVDNSAGPAPEVFYAMPYTTFSKGAIGLQPVKSPGLFGLLAIVVGLPLLVALCCVGAAFLAD